MALGYGGTRLVRRACGLSRKAIAKGIREIEALLRWICKSTRAIAKELGRQKHPISHAKVAQILHGLEYNLQSNRKTDEVQRPRTACYE